MIDIFIETEKMLVIFYQKTWWILTIAGLVWIVVALLCKRSLRQEALSEQARQDNLNGWFSVSGDKLDGPPEYTPRYVGEFGIMKCCKLITDSTPTAAEMAKRVRDNFERLAFQNQGILARILNVPASPSWAIDAGCD